MATTKDHLIAWLRDAHAMEEQAETMLSSQSRRLGNYPELKARIDQHIEETRAQARRLEGCLDRLGNRTSSLKDISGKVVALGQGVSGMFADDEVVKGSLASYTFEHMEIASYKILIAAAEQAGESDVIRVCKINLHEEEAMAEWLDQHTAGITRKFLNLEAADQTAKR